MCLAFIKLLLCYQPDATDSFIEKDIQKPPSLYEMTEFGKIVAMKTDVSGNILDDEQDIDHYDLND